VCISLLSATPGLGTDHAAALAGESEVALVNTARGVDENALPWPLSPLIGSMAQAARRNDRETFDRLFDCCFAWVYAVAWRLTHDTARAEAITAHLLHESLIEIP
jgi:hypothetical protein